MKNLHQEMQEWQKFVFGDIPLLYEDPYVNVLCTYAEVYEAPFKFKNLFLFSYEKRYKYLYFRNEADIEGAINKVNEGVFEDWTKTFHEAPERFKFYRGEDLKKRKYWEIWNRSDSAPHNIHDWPFGSLTGNYYVDLYGYVWLEIRAHFLENVNQRGWVRETAIRYEWKKELQEAFKDARANVMKYRNKADLSEILENKYTWLAAASIFFLASR